MSTISPIFISFCRTLGVQPGYGYFFSPSSGLLRPQPAWSIPRPGFALQVRPHRPCFIMEHVCIMPCIWFTVPGIWLTRSCIYLSPDNLSVGSRTLWVPLPYLAPTGEFESPLGPGGPYFTSSSCARASDTAPAARESSGPSPHPSGT